MSSNILIGILLILYSFTNTFIDLTLNDLLHQSMVDWVFLDLRTGSHEILKCTVFVLVVGVFQDLSGLSFKSVLLHQLELLFLELLILLFLFEGSFKPSWKHS